MKTKSTPSEALGKNIQKSEEALAVLNDAITRLRKNEYTIRANAADENRDSLYKALVLRLESDMLCYFDPQVQQSAKGLYEIIVNNGRILKHSANDGMSVFLIRFGTAGQSSSKISLRIISGNNSGLTVK